MVQYQLKLKPTPRQERQLNRWLFHLTAVWNWAIKRVERDAEVGVYHTSISFRNLLNGHGAKMGIAQDALCGTLWTAHTAWQRCFKHLSRKPRFKGRRNRLNSIAFAHGARIVGDRVHVQIIGKVRFHKQSIPTGRIGQIRIVKRASGWYLCLLIQTEPNPVPVMGEGQIGIDPGFKSLLTLSDGEKIDHPRELEAAAARLAQAQRGNDKHLARRIQERAANRRKDRNHKLSRRLVSQNALIAFSADDHSAIAKRFGKSVTSSSHFQLRQMLAYKCRAGGREYIEVFNRNSTKTCSNCGALSGPSGLRTLAVRQWRCSDCGSLHDRDVNAAMNTLHAALGGSVERPAIAV